MRFSELVDARRIDAEFASHPDIDWQGSLLRTRKFVSLSDIVSFIGSGHTPLQHDVSEGDVGFATVECVGPLQFEAAKLKRIWRHQFDNEFATKRVAAGTVLCTIKRRICQAYPFVSEPKDPIAINQDLALLRPREGFSAAYLAAYLSCKVGQSFADRQRTEQMNPYISVANLSTLPVAILGDKFQGAVEDTFMAAQRQFDRAEQHLILAEQTLLRALGLENWQPPEPLTYTRSAADVLSAGRFDAAYFSPAKDSALAALGRKGAQPLSSYYSAVREMIDPPGNARLLNYDVGAASFAVIDDATPIVEEFDSAKKAMRPGDVVISRLRHYLRQIAVVRTPPDRMAVGSSEFVVLHPTSDALPPEALVLLLRSPAVQTILEYSQDGSQHPRFNDGVVLDLPVSPALLSVAPKLVAAVRSAHAARREALALLAQARRAVEIAIEESESASLAFLRE